MREIVHGVYQLQNFPPNVVNVYLIGDVLIDAGTRFTKDRILRQLTGHTVTAHALTHAHPDHQGSSASVCDALNIPLWGPAGDCPATESGDLSNVIPQNPLTATLDVIWTGRGHPVARELREGDIVAGFEVIDTPGHSPGHVSYWRASDRTLIAGDALMNMNMFTMQEELGEPPALFTVDRTQNVMSIKKLAALNPKTIVFGHGKPLLDGARLADFAAGLT